ncbi:MAG TPA: hypothetical protein VK660_00365 [Xanthomonadaceae bacterium]|jgi:hypothetical protein|nr:hypothetical protein [Xanthomonadaceae bacterium]
MKIQTTQNQMIIDNSNMVFVVVGALLGLGGIVAAILGLIGHNNVEMAIGAGLAIMGALFVFVTKSTHIVLDKSGPSSLSSKTIVSQTTTQSFNLSEVTTVLLEAREASETVKNPDGSTRNQTKITANLILVTSNAQRIPIGSATRTMDIGGLIGSLITTLPLKNEAEQIAKFIGVPMQASDTAGPLNSLL